VSVLDVDTAHGPARVHLHPATAAGEAVARTGALVLGHGAGGGVAAPDLVAVRDAALDAGWSVALVEQPYRVAGRRSPAPAHQLDAAWTAVVAELRAGPLADVRLVTGGRSSGARVACRTAAACDALGVLCLAFPLHPPGRPERTRLGELEAVDRPVLIVQGVSDPFGMPPAAERERGRSREVVTVPGDHSLKRDPAAVAAAVTAWLGRLPR
jgi:predicted alpha/beta-hydrolase family hydrolase